MRVLVACEFSGTVRDAFAARGHDAWSCDLLPSESPGNHIIGDVLHVIATQEWDLMIAHPPCTFLTRAGARWFNEKLYGEKARQRKLNQADAIQFVKALAKCNIPKIAIENPIGVLSTQWRKPDQIIQPYQFGHASLKATCLWLRGLEKLIPTQVVEPEYIVLRNGQRYSKWSYDTFKLSPDVRRKVRSKTFAGIATAMAAQWG